MFMYPPEFFIPARTPLEALQGRAKTVADVVW